MTLNRELLGPRREALEHRAASLLNRHTSRHEMLGDALAEVGLTDEGADLGGAGALGAGRELNGGAGGLVGAGGVVVVSCGFMVCSFRCRR